jgi:ketosteroid isomerase-like protein
MTQLSDLARALKHSFDTGDRGPWEKLMAPGCVNWHNTDKKVVPSLGLKAAAALKDVVKELETDVVKDVAFPGGHLIVIIVRGLVPHTGRRLNAHNCIVLEITDQGITRIDDYVDPDFGEAFKPLEKQ